MEREVIHVKKNISRILIAILLLATISIFLLSMVYADDALDPPLTYVYNPATRGSNDLKSADAFNVNLYSGSARYSYPITVPPGTHNLQPQFALFYNSQSTPRKPGVVGEGWDITQNYIQRDVNNTPTDTSDDSFKLVLGGALYDLVYVPNDKRYHTTIETFMFIENKSGGNNTQGVYWVVKTKDGTAYRFGFNNDSEALSTDYNHSWRWNLDLVNDTYGNSIFYTYDENPFSGDKGAVYLNRIEYNNDKKRKISFAYESSDRYDLWSGYEGSSKVSQSRRLKEINITADGNLFGKYSINYVRASTAVFSFITNITRFGSDGNTTLPPTKFNYFPEINNWSSKSWSWESQDKFVSNKCDQGLRVVDINRDGLVDILKANPDFSKKVWINNRTGWAVDGNWTIPASIKFNLHSSSGCNKDAGTRLADINGDGLTDIIRAQSDSPNIYEVWLNNGTGWINYTVNWSWENQDYFVDSNSVDNGLRIIDVNGDGLVDIVKGKQGTSRKVWLNNGTGWTVNNNWQLTHDFVRSDGMDIGTRLADVNGDDLVDIIRAWESCHTGDTGCTGRTEEYSVMINNGTGWSSTSWGWEQREFFETGTLDKGIRMIDVNGDGLVDISKSFNGGRKTWLNNGTGWYVNSNWTPNVDYTSKWTEIIIAGDIVIIIFHHYDPGTILTDVNGDGLVDIVFTDESSYSVYLNNPIKSYLLKNGTNQFGGVTSVDYRTSTSLNNTGNDSISDLGFNVWVVANKTENNGMNNSHNVTSLYFYNYSGGLYDYKNKEFRGFNYVEEMISNKTIRHRFHQDNGRKSRESTKETLDILGNPYRKVDVNWNATLKDGYYITFLLEQSEFSHDGVLSNPKRKNMSYSYDSFGNVIRIHHKGDVSNTIDDRYEYFEYANNSASWIVDKIKHHSFFDFDNTTKTRESFYSYDNLQYGQSPTRGSVTRKDNWLDTNNKNITINYTYNNFGNLVNETDPNGRITQYIYEIRDTTNTFVDRKINAKNHIFDYRYDLSTGNLLSETDANGIIINYTYDVFSRIAKEILPFDNETYPTKNYTYEFDGTASEKIKISLREESSKNNTFNMFNFYDGFGRLIQTQYEADNSGGTIQTIIYDTFYDQTGRIKTQSNPYYSIQGGGGGGGSLDDGDFGYLEPISSINRTNYLYDPLDRIIKLVNPDGSLKNISYDRWNVTVHDENSHKKNYQLDVYGQIIKVSEYNLDGVYDTPYKYNPAGDMVEIKDAQNNLFNFTYDSLGRKIKSQDPDLGIWNYSYDGIGNLITQKDNRNITLSLEYDELNRVTKKISSTENITYIYDQGKNTTLSQVQTSAITINYTYDNRLRKIKEERVIDGKRFILNWSYDAMDRVTSKNLPSGNNIAHAYNSQGMMLSIRGILNITYNERDQPLKRRYMSNVSNLETNFTYRGDNFRLIRIKTDTKQDLNYDYDNVGNVKKINDTANLRISSMEYDFLDRLTYTNIKDDKQGKNNFLNYTYNKIGNMLQILFNDQNITFSYGQTLAHAPIKMQHDIPLLNDTRRFNIKDNNGKVVAWFGNRGNIALKGYCTAKTTCNAPPNSFIIANSTDTTVAYIDNEGNLCIEKGDCSDRSLTCNPTRDAFIIQNASGTNVSYIDFNGDLCLTRRLYENSKIEPISLDTDEPIVMIINPQNITYTTSSIPFNFTLNEPGSCLYSLNGGITNYTMTANASDTHFNATNDSIADGSYTVNAYCNDTEGNRNDAVFVVFRKDATPPVVTINQPQSQTYSSFPIKFNVTLNENGNACNYTLNNGINNKTMQKNGNRDFNDSNASMADGSYTVRYYCWDTSNNLNGSATRTFSVDTKVSLVTILSPENITYENTPIFFNFTLDEPGSCNYSLNGGIKNYTMTSNSSDTGFNATNTSIANGSYTANAYCMDIFGHRNNTVKVTFSLEKSDLLITSFVQQYPTGNPLAGENITMAFTIFNNGTANATDVFWRLDTGSPDPDPVNTVGLRIDAGKGLTVFTRIRYASPGSYTAAITADWENIIDELNEINNDRQKNITVI